MPQILVINYHRIVEDHEREAVSEDGLFWITRAAFEAQIREIQRLKIPVVSLNEYAGGSTPDGFSIAITFDDNFLSDYTIAFPILKQAGFPATFFRIAEWKEEDRTTIAQCREMIAAGFTFGSHGLTHKLLNDLPEAEISHELKSSKEILAVQLETQIDMFSFAYGGYNQDVLKEVVSCGYKLAATTRVQLNDPTSKKVLLHRWSVKRGTDLVEFTGMISRTEILTRAILSSAIKTTARKMVGPKLTARLNVIRNRRK